MQNHNRKPLSRVDRVKLAFSVCALLICAGAERPAFAQSFATPVNYTAGANPSAVAVADFNGDGRLDLAVSNNFSQTASVFLGNSDGTFGTRTDYAVGANPYGIVAVDFNGDGKIDLATGNSFGATSNLSVLLGNGDGTFQSRVDYLFSGLSQPNGLAQGNLNGDGRPDLITIDGSGVSVLLNKGDGTFNSPVSYAAGNFATSVAVGDFNGDGKLDLAASSYGGNNGMVSIFVGKGDGTFFSAVNYAAGPSPFAIATHDFNGDGKLDLTTANIQVDTISVLLGNGDGTFQSAVNYPAGPSPYALTTGDIDTDGKPDIIMAGNGFGLAVLVGNGDGTFGAPLKINAGGFLVAAADLNGDGKPDLVSSTQANSLSVLLNQTGPYSISGIVSDLNSNVLSGVVITLTGAAPLATTTGANGGYSFKGLMAGGNYVLTPSRTNYVFAPASQPFNNLSANQIVDFTGVLSRFAIGGVVRDANAVGLANVTVSLSGSSSAITTTASDGSYSFAPVPAGANYLISVSLTGYAFAPPNQSVINLTASRTANFTASPVTFNITGSVKNFRTNNALFGATVFASGSAARFATLSSDGNYSLFSLPAGGNYTVSATTFQAGQLFSRLVLSSPATQTFSNLQAAATANFTGTALDYAIGISPTSMALADFNADGKLDIAVTSGGTSGAISLLLGAGLGMFQNAVSIPVGCTPQTVIAEDFNGDGKIDLVTANNCGNSISVLLGNGNGTFHSAVSFPLGLDPIAMTAGDLNSDGVLDLVTTNHLGTDGHSISVLLGNGNGTFGTVTTFNSPAATSSVLGDFNADGKLDLATANSGTNNISVFLGNGNGTFQAATNFTVAAGPFAVATGDLNGDGKLDLLTTNLVNDSVSVLLGAGTGVFGAATNFPVGDEPHGLSIGDLNGDGKLDLAVPCFNSGAVTLMGNGDGTFQAAVTNEAAAGNVNKVAIGDLNQDGKLDLAAAIFYSNEVSVLLNVIPVAPTANISGKVTANGAPLAGVTLTLAGSQPGTTITDSNGNYLFSSLPAGGSYVVTPSRNFFAFTPQGQTFANLLADAVANFTATPITPGIVGRVTDSAGVGLGGVTLTLSGAQSASTISNANGTYGFYNLTGGANYVVTPSAASGTFTPTGRAINNLSTFNFVADFRSSIARVVQFAAAANVVAEDAGAAVITVTRSGDLTAAASIDYATSDGSAHQNKDYTFASGRLAFGPGESSQSFNVLITDNAFVDGNRTVNLILSNPTGAVFGFQSSASLSIADNDTVAPSTNPLDNPDAQFFVRQHYYDFLNRLPDPSGFAFWTGQITQCDANSACVRTKKIDVSNAFFYELEYQQTGAYVYRLYRAAFGDNQPFPNPFPDTNNPGEEKKIVAYQAFVPDRARVVGGANLAQSQLDLANAFVLRAEFQARYPASLDGPGFVDAVLATINNDLGADLMTQRAALISLFNSAGRGAVMYKLADDNQWNPIANRPLIDAEYNRAFVATQYFGYLRRDPDVGGFLFWLGQVNSAPRRDVAKQHAMVCSFTTSAEYQLRFSSVVTHSNLECQ